MRDYVEYELRLPDGSLRYEIVDLTEGADPAMKQVGAFMRLHGAIAAKPLED